MALVSSDLNIEWRAVVGILRYEYEIRDSGSVLLRTGFVDTNRLIYTHASATADGIEPSIDISIRSYDTVNNAHGAWQTITIANPFVEVAVPVAITGSTGFYTSADGKTVTVTNGVITSIV